MTKPLITVAMPCRNEAGFIETCLQGLRAQTYPRDRIEILIADGDSNDGTREILDRLAREDTRITVLHNPRRIQAAGLNLAIAAARGDVIARMDVHADYAPDYLERCVEVLARTGADNAGGAARCRAKGSVQKAVCAALQSRLGFGGAAFRNVESEGYVDTLFPGAFRKEVFDTVGLFDERAVTNEDAELNQRILEAGGRIYLSREIEVYYYPRDSLAGLARQYFRYGSGRARTLLKRRGILRLSPALPFLALVVAIVATLTVPRLAAGAAVLYASAAAVEAIRLAVRLKASAVLTWLAFPIMHVSHGLGFGVGLLRFTMRPNWPRP